PDLTERKPRAALFDDAEVGCEIEEVPRPGDPLAVHDVELRLPEGRSELVLDHLDARAAPHRLASLLERLRPADVETDGGVELESSAAGLDLRGAEHHPYLLPDLVGEDEGR